MAHARTGTRIGKTQFLPAIVFTLSAMLAVLGFVVGVLPALLNVEVDLTGTVVFVAVMLAGIEGCRRSWARM